MSNKSRQRIKREEQEENYNVGGFLCLLYLIGIPHLNEGGKRFSPSMTKKGQGASWVCGHFSFKTKSPVDQADLDLELLTFLPLTFECGDYWHVAPRLVYVVLESKPKACACVARTLLSAGFLVCKLVGVCIA